ncbi:putative high mobility group B protein 11 isoform X2 [Solanum lycopersicum]|uniref:putative high mobility group B protein 11 isoform X2 n=1 Tax=Solanum lycopersicum TaxID=4081 RepID=UPI000532D126|nr:high mobility group B protein 10-like isoform X2 [Solanum lycopersicum]
MAAEENNTVAMEKKIHGGDKFSGAGTYACGFSSPIVAGDISTMQNLAGGSYYDGKDSFYEKLNKLNEPSGLSLVFNLRQTNLDLHLFYEEVIKRGGFNQVTKDAKWGEVACTLHVKSNITIFPTQLQKVYENLLLQLEQLYYYRSREKGTTMQPPSQVSDAARLEPVKDYSLSLGSADRSDDSAGKRKFCDRSSPVATLHSNDKDGPVEKRKCKNDSRLVSTGPETPEQKSQSSSTNRHLRKDPGAPIRGRSSYQMYVKLECERQKKVLGESYGSKKVRDMAINAWKTLSENEKEPYIEASKLDKERYIREMAAYEQHKNKETTTNPNLLSGLTPSMINFGAPSVIDHVTSQGDTGSNIIPDASFTESTVQRPNSGKTSNPIFQMNWGYLA